MICACIDIFPVQKLDYFLVCMILLFSSMFRRLGFSLAVVCYFLFSLESVRVYGTIFGEKALPVPSSTPILSKEQYGIGAGIAILLGEYSSDVSCVW